MPYTLFARLTSDRALMLYFAGIFVLCLLIACLSLFIDEANVGTMALLALWALAAILTMIFVSFGRALRFISPAYQLSHILSTTRKGFERFSRRARRYAPLLAN